MKCSRTNILPLPTRRHRIVSYMTKHKTLVPFLNRRHPAWWAQVVPTGHLTREANLTIEATSQLGNLFINRYIQLGKFIRVLDSYLHNLRAYEGRFIYNLMDLPEFALLVAENQPPKL